MISIILYLHFSPFAFSALSSLSIPPHLVTPANITLSSTFQLMNVTVLAIKFLHLYTLHGIFQIDVIAYIHFSILI
jgi:hypothetical protein